MGLYLGYVPKGAYMTERLNETSFSPDVKKTIRKILRETDDCGIIPPRDLEHLVVISRLSSCTDEDKYFIDLLYHLYGPNSQLPGLEPLFAKYVFILGDESVVSETKVGSYSTIHYLRSFCDKVFKYLQKGVQINEEIVSEILEECSRSNWDYDLKHCPALCNHSDCDGYYLPIIEPFDFEHGSLYQLVLELDKLYSCGALDVLNRFNDRIGIDPILWSFKILMYHALSCLKYYDILIFC